MRGVAAGRRNPAVGRSGCVVHLRSNPHLVGEHTRVVLGEGSAKDSRRCRELTKCAVHRRERSAQSAGRHFGRLECECSAVRVGGRGDLLAGGLRVAQTRVERSGGGAVGLCRCEACGALQRAPSAARLGREASAARGGGAPSALAVRGRVGRQPRRRRSKRARGRDGRARGRPTRLLRCPEVRLAEAALDMAAEGRGGTWSVSLPPSDTRTVVPWFRSDSLGR